MTSTTVPTTTTTPAVGRYFGTEAVGFAGLPRSESYCAANILRNAWEPRPLNTLYNIPRLDEASPYDSWWTSYPRWLTRRALITGNVSGLTTTELYSWAGCRWGIDEDLLRAVSVQESDWRQRFTGDVCGPVGQASYGIMQVKNRNCSNAGDWGGYPRTYDSTPYNIDFDAAALRGCMEREFWYTYPAGVTFTDLVRGCVGAWFAGSFQATSSYTNSVYAHLANRDWTAY